jgi:hypothetical protein
MIEEFKNIAKNYTAPFCEKCSEVDLTFGLGNSCLFCEHRFNPEYNENQTVYCLDVLRHYFLNSTIEEDEDILSIKEYFSYVNLKQDNLVDELFEFNKLINKIDKISIEDKGYFQLNPIGNININSQAIKSDEDALVVLELGVLMVCLINIQNSI